MALFFTVIGGVSLEGLTGVPPSSPRENMGQRGGKRQEGNPGSERNPEREGEGNDPVARSALEITRDVWPVVGMTKGTLRDD